MAVPGDKTFLKVTQAQSGKRAQAILPDPNFSCHACRSMYYHVRTLYWSKSR